MWWHDKHVGLSLLSRPGQVWERAAARLPSPAPVGRRSVLRAAGAMAMAALAGGNVRVGLEDNLYLGPGHKATNAELVARAKQLLESMNVRILGPQEVRDKLKLVKHT